MHDPVLEAREPRTVHALLNIDALSCKFDVDTSRHVGAALEPWRELLKRAMAVLHVVERGGQPLREVAVVRG